MSTNIKLKRSSVAGNIPTTSQLSLGELAINTADGAIYSKKSDNSIFAIHDNTIMAFNSADDHIDIYGSLTVSPTTAGDAITLGATAQTGTITLGRSTADNTINIGNAQTVSGATQNINIGGGNAIGGDTVLNLAANSQTAANTAVTIGGSNSTGTMTVAIRGASTFTNGAVAFNGGNFTVTPPTVTNTIALGATAQTGIITLGQSTATNTINIGNAVTANEATQTINIGGGNASGGDTVLNLAANVNTAADTAVTIGNSNSTGTHTVAIRGASTFTNGNVSFNGGDFTVNPASTSNTITIGKTTGTGTITLGHSAATNTINIGNTALPNASEQTVNIASGSGSGTSTVNIAACNAQGSDTAVTIGGGDPNFGTTTVAIRGTTTLQYGDINFQGHDFNVIPSTDSRTITIGKTTQNATGIITLGQSTKTNTINIGNGAGENDATQTINLASGTGLATVNIAAKSGSGQTTAVNIGNSTSSASSTIGIRGASTFSVGNVAFNGYSFTVDPSVTASTITIGKTTGTGTITLGRSTQSQTINIGTGSVASTKTKAINIGTNSATGSTTNIAIGPAGEDDSTLNIGAATGNCTLNIGTGATTVTHARTINIGTAAATGGAATVNIGTTLTSTAGVNFYTGTSSKTTFNTVGNSLAGNNGIALVNNPTSSASTSNFQMYSYNTDAVQDTWYASGAACNYIVKFGQSQEKFRFKVSGSEARLGIGTNNPLGALHVTGNIIATGNVTAYYSDERLKDFKGAIPDALDKVNKLTGYYYKPNALAHSLGVDNTELEVGVSAQEVESVLPEVVTDSAVGRNEFGENYKTVQYDRLTPLLIESIKELTQKVAELEAKLEEKGE